MPVLAIFTGNNVTKQMYETLRKEVDWEHNHAAGFLIIQATTSVWPIFGNQKRS